MKKIRNIILVLVFLGMLVSLSAMTLLKESSGVSLTENRVLSQFKKPHLSTVLNSDFQDNLEDSFSDQFVYRFESLEVYKKGETLLTNIVYSFVDAEKDTESMLLYPIGDNVYKVGSDGDYLVEFPVMASLHYYEKAERRIANYNDVAKHYPNVDFYIYRVTSPMDENWFDEENEIISNGSYYDSMAEKGLSNDIVLKSLDLISWDNYKIIHYKTDHHWNYLGAYQGYQDIINMIAVDHKEVGKPKSPTSTFCSEAKFYGSYVKRSNYNLDEKVYDTVCEYIYDNVNDYKVYVNDEEVEEYGSRTLYRQGIYDAEKGVNHYREYFGVDSAKVVYDFGENTGINAIFFTDSYTNAIRPELASHFDKTFFIDLRHYYDTYGDFFNFKKIVEENDIDVVAYVGSSSVCYTDDVYMLNYY